MIIAKRVDTEILPLLPTLLAKREASAQGELTANMTPPRGARPKVSRYYGIVLLIALLLLAVALRQRAVHRSERIRANELVMTERFDGLVGVLQSSITERDPPTRRLARLAEQPGLVALQGVGDDRSAFAEGEFYVYGLGLTSIVDPETGRRGSGWVLRAWPRIFGVTGDIEFHSDHRGEIWHGQNEVGRSGTQEGFPPSFPEKNIGQARQTTWWHSPR